MTPDQLSDRILDFSVQVGRLVDRIPDTRMGRHIAGQLVRSGTSPAPNYEEARAAESRADFVHKLSICMKELRESRIWLRMLLKCGLLPADSLGPALDECSQLCSIVGQSINTTKRGSPTNGRPTGQ